MEPSPSRPISRLRCRLCWSITFAVFLSILAIEALILIPSYRTFHDNLLTGIEEQGLVAARSLFRLTSPVQSEEKLLAQGDALTAGKALKGAALYHADGRIVGVFGEIPELSHAAPESADADRRKRFADGRRLDALWSPETLGAPYLMVGRMVSETVDGALRDFLLRIGALVMVIALFVTFVTMYLLGRKVLHPILQLRSHMEGAGQDHDNPGLYRLPPGGNNEMGAAFNAFNAMLERINGDIMALRQRGDALFELKTHLEERVATRTLELQDANRQLEEEMGEKAKALMEIRNLARFPDENPNPILRVDPAGEILYANAAADRLFPAPPSPDGDAPRPLPPEWTTLIQETLESGKVQEMSLRGDDATFSVQLVPLPDYVNIYGLDISDRVEAERRSLSLARFPEENSNPVLRVGSDGEILYANRASAPLLAAWKSKPGGTLPVEWRDLVADSLGAETDKEIELPHGERTFSVRLAPVPDEGYVNLYGADVTERKHFEEQLIHHANHDPLTGLPNRSLFRDRLSQAIEAARSEGRMAAVFFVGLDGFTEINQGMGRGAGDVILKATAHRLEEETPQSATVARFTGDVFAIVLGGVREAAQAGDLATRLLESFKAPIPVQGGPVEVAASIGVSLYPNDAEKPEALTHRADLAMYRAKADASRGYGFYEEGMNEAVQERRTTLNDLRQAEKRGELVLMYQPQVCLDTDKVVGMEALIRWRHPARGLISPGLFIPLAEESGLIVPIGLWVLRTACIQNKAWQEMGLPPMRMAVNLSSVQFGQPDLVEQVQAALTKTDLDPEWLELEITESVAMHDADATIATMQALHDLGIRLSIDDFGTGYSSLSYLKRFPVHKMKIDQSFVRNLETDPDDAAICGAVIRLAHSLKLKSIAEGVETEAQRDWIKAEGCNQIQGYFYSRPLEEEDFTAFVQEWNAEEAEKEA